MLCSRPCYGHRLAKAPSGSRTRQRRPASISRTASAHEKLVRCSRARAAAASGSTTTTTACRIFTSSAASRSDKGMHPYPLKKQPEILRTTTSIERRQRQVHRCHRPGRRRGEHVQHGRHRRRLRQRRLRRSVRHRLRPGDSLSQQRRTAPSPMSPRKPESTWMAGRSVPHGWTTIETAAWTCSSAAT